MAERGERVIVKADGGVALVQLVWGSNERAVYVTDESNLAKIAAGVDASLPIGFPREDLFRYDAGAERKIGTAEWRWERLLPFT